MTREQSIATEHVEVFRSDLNQRLGSLVRGSNNAIAASIISMAIVYSASLIASAISSRNQPDA